MTNFELIKSFDVNAMATMLSVICYERDKKLLETLVANGIDATLVNVAPKIQVEYHKKWLLEQADFEEESEDTE